MENKNTSEIKETQKLQTKYDRKMAAKKQKEVQDKKDEKRFKMISRIVIAVVIIGIVAGIAAPVYVKYHKANSTYLKIGDREVTGLEYDYYYNSSTYSYINTYSSILPYLGLDTSVDLADQPYSNDMSWKDMFDQMAVEQMQQIFALAKEAEAVGFSYDVDAEYAEHVAAIEEAATAYGVSVKKYYESTFGESATEENMEPILKEGILATAYYNHLITENMPAGEEVTAYYNENKQDYDKVDYRSFAFTADVTTEGSEADKIKDMEEQKAKADAFMADRQAGSDFEELCIANASEDEKANYEDAETEYCFSEGKYNLAVPAALREWLYDEARAEGDIAVIEDADNSCYYVVEFSQRYFDEADNEAIANLLAAEKVTEYIDTLIAQAPVEDINGVLKYLTLGDEANAIDIEVVE